MPPATPTTPRRAALFVTCIIDQLYPQVGASVVRVLRRHGVAVSFPPGQTCCGQPLYNAGFTTQARRLAARVLDTFSNPDDNANASTDAVTDPIVIPSGSCGAMLRVFYLDLFADDPVLFPKAQSLARRTYEFTEFLAALTAPPGAGNAPSAGNAPNVDDAPNSNANADTDPAPAAAPVTAAYHPSCHLLRELGVRDAPRRLLAAAPGLSLADLPDAEQCCGFGGAFAVKYPHISEQMLADKLDAITRSGADTITACDLGCLMHIAGAVSRRNLPIRARHIAQLLDNPAA